MYRKKALFPYADGYYAIFPTGLKNKVGKGTVVVEDEYIIYFKPNTPDEVKERLTKDYAAFHKKEKELGHY